MNKVRFCQECGILLNARHKIKFCSNKCQSEYRFRKWVSDWKNGIEDGNIGILAKNISGFLKRYLHEKFQNKCSRCGWSEIHSVTGVVPVEIEHLDGNAENNKEDNLTLLCPNCHSLTPFYKNLNKGKGRKWRMEKYIKNDFSVSYRKDKKI